MKIDKNKATQILLEEAEKARLGRDVPEDWKHSIDEFCKMAERQNRTFIAAIGTALLAKSTDPLVDVFTLKAGTRDHNENRIAEAYSARAVGHDVLAAHARPLEIHLGATGKEPLNNQPFFRETYISENWPVHERTKPILRQFVTLIGRIDRLSQEAARRALRAFLAARYQPYEPPKFADFTNENLTSSQLAGLIKRYTEDDAEGGRRAQAAAAALIDVRFGHELVSAGERVNDPDRRVPGDVVVYEDDFETVKLTLEVRAKPVSGSDLFHIVGKAFDAGVAICGLVAVAPNQQALDLEPVNEWAEERRISFRVFSSWLDLVEELIFWSGTSFPAKRVLERIHKRSIELEVSEAGIALWSELYRSAH